jgi:Na+-transporting NADH:ubiquinone oxidoreductase subunit C
MKNYSNTYIFIFSIIMVVVVAAILSFAAINLKPIQIKNVEVEKKQNILSSINVNSTSENAIDKYDKYITDSYVVNSQGEIVEDKDAFGINISDELYKDPEDRFYPVYIASIEGKGEVYILPFRGKGLWGPIWGYLSFQQDFNTIYGAYFDHAKETPGLGAEIANEEFQVQFQGKEIFNEEGELVSIKVVKGAAPGNEHAVDGISGGTITSKGVQDMLDDILKGYKPFIKKMRS